MISEQHQCGRSIGLITAHRSQLPNPYRRISGHNRVRLHAFRNDRSGRDDRVFPDDDAFQNHCVHPDPDVVRDFHRSGFQPGTCGAILEIRRESLRVDETLGRFKRVKIGIRDPDVPRNQAIRPDLDRLIRHDQRAVQQREIAYRTPAVLADRKRTAGVTRNMLADNDST